MSQGLPKYKKRIFWKKALTGFEKLFLFWVPLTLNAWKSKLEVASFFCHLNPCPAGVYNLCHYTCWIWPRFQISPCAELPITRNAMMTWQDWPFAKCSALGNRNWKVVSHPKEREIYGWRTFQPGSFKPKLQPQTF